MRDPSTSPAFLRVERDMNVSGLSYEFSWTGKYAPQLSFPGLVYAMRIRVDEQQDLESEVRLVADQVQEAVLDSGQVGPLRTWPRASRGGAPLWARLRDGLAVWESADGAERYKIGELPVGR